MAKKKKFHPPRETVSREDYYMGLAWTIAAKSKDPSTQVGAIIVSFDNRPLGIGYNGPPKQILDSEIDWVRPEKYLYIDHAEDNAIDYSSEKPKGATIYITGRPCPRCMRRIVKNGIIKVVYFEPRITESGSMLADDEQWKNTQKIAKLGAITLDKYKGNINWLRDWTANLHEKGIFA